MAKLLATLATLAVMYTGVAQAQEATPPVSVFTFKAPCWPIARVQGILGGVHKEAPVVQGLTDGGALIEVYASKKGESFTMVVTHIDKGVTCLMASGKNLHSLRYIMPKPKMQGDL